MAATIATLNKPNRIVQDPWSAVYLYIQNRILQNEDSSVSSILAEHLLFKVCVFTL